MQTNLTTFPAVNIAKLKEIMFGDKKLQRRQNVDQCEQELKAISEKCPTSKENSLEKNN